MNDKQIKQLRAALIAVLDDEDGICEAGFNEHRKLADAVAPGLCDDIFDAVEATDGRYYLSMDHGLVA